MFHWDHPLAFHIDLRGGLSQFYGGETDKMLGMLFGLEQAAKPLQLRVGNPTFENLEELFTDFDKEE